MPPRMPAAGNPPGYSGRGPGTSNRGHRMTDRLETLTSNGSGADVDAAETSEWLEAVDAVVVAFEQLK
jgi:hypothetical protein